MVTHVAMTRAAKKSEKNNANYLVYGVESSSVYTSLLVPICQPSPVC